MGSFDPDAYLATPEVEQKVETKFDPDAYLAQEDNSIPTFTESELEKKGMSPEKVSPAEKFVKETLDRTMPYIIKRVNDNPNDVEAMYQLGRAQLLMKDYGSALSTFTGLAAKHPQQGEYKQGMANAEYFLHQQEQAKKTQTEGLAQIPDEQPPSIVEGQTEMGASGQPINVETGQLIQTPESERMKNVVGSMERIASPFTAPVASYDAAIHSFKESGKAFEENKNVLGSLKAAKGVVEGIIGGAMAAPSGLLFNMGAQAIEQGGADMEWVFSPVTKTFKEQGDYDLLNDEMKTVLSFADLAVVGKAMHKLGKPFSDIEKSPPTKEQVAEAKKEITPENIASTVENLDNPEGAKIQERLNKLSKEAENPNISDQTRKIIDRKIAETSSELKEQNKKFSEQNLVKAEREGKIKQLESDIENISDEEIKDELQNEIEKIKSEDIPNTPKMPEGGVEAPLNEPINQNKDAVQKPITEGVDVRQQASDGEKMGEGNAKEETPQAKVEVTPDELQHLEHLKELKSLDEEGFQHQDKLDELEAKVKAGKEEGDKIAAENGYDSATHLLNSVKKNVGQEFATVQEALKSPEVQQFLKDKAETAAAQPAETVNTNTNGKDENVGEIREGQNGGQKGSEVQKEEKVVPSGGGENPSPSVKTPTNEPTTTTRISEPVDKGADKGKLADSGEGKKAGKLEDKTEKQEKKKTLDYTNEDLEKEFVYYKLKTAAGLKKYKDQLKSKKQSVAILEKQTFPNRSMINMHKEGIDFMEKVLSRLEETSKTNKPSISEIKSEVISKAPEAKASAKKEGVSLKVQKDDLLNQISEAQKIVEKNGVNEKALNDAGFKTTMSEAGKKASIGYSKEELQIVFDVEGDGTFHLAANGLKEAHEQVKKHWSTNEQKKPTVSTGNRMPSQKAIGKYNTLAEAEQSKQNAIDNLEQARKSGDRDLIETYQKQAQLESEKYKQFRQSYESLKERIAENENKVKSRAESKYDAEDILELPKKKEELANLEGKEYIPEKPDYDLAESALKKALAKAEKEHTQYIEGHLKKDGTLKSSIPVGAQRRIDSATNEIADIKTRLENLRKERDVANSELKATASRLRAKKIGKDNAYMLPDLGISKWVYNGALEFCAKQVEGGTSLGKAIENTIKFFDKHFKDDIDKDNFRKHLKQSTYPQDVKWDGNVSDKAVAADKIDLSTLPRIKGGTSRDVYDLGDGKVIKVARNAKGIEQNGSMGFGDMNMLQPHVPELFEQGKDYIVTEKVLRNDKEIKKFLQPLQKFNSSDFKNQTPELQDAMEKMGLSDFNNYDLLWNDFTAPRNWGMRADGTPVLIDEGALNSRVHFSSVPDQYTVKEWRDIKNKRVVAPEGAAENIRERAQKLKDSVTAAGEAIKKGAKKLGLSIDDPNVQKMGFSFDDVVDATVKLIHKGIDIHGNVKKAIDEAIEKIKGTKLYKDIIGDKGADFENMVRSSIEIKTESLEHGAGKKAVVGRVHEGDVPKNISEAVEKHGLNYTIESHPEAEKKASDFIADVGVEKALNAAREGKIDGGAETFVWTAAIDAVHKEYLAESNPSKKEKLLEKETGLIDEFDKKMRSQGRSISALQAAYQTADLGYKLGAILNRAKEASGESGVSEILKEKLTDLSSKLDEVTKKLADAEKKLKETPPPKIIKEPLGTKRSKHSLSSEELTRKQELSKKYRGVFNDVTRVITTIAEKEFREYAGLVLKEAAGDFKIFAREMINTVGKEIREHLPKLYKELGGKENPEMERIQKQLKREIDEYERRKREKDFTKKEPKEKPNLDEETFNLLVEKNRLKEEIDTEIERERLKNRPIGEKINDGFIDAVSLPKSLMASADMSAPLRQGAVLSFRHPIMASHAIKEMFRQAFSEKKSKEWLTRLKSTPEYYDIKKAGLYLAEPTARLTAKEEQFISNIAHHIPVWGKIVKGSERAYTGYLNKLRVDVFTAFHDALLRDGFKGKQLDAELKSYADFVNNASGRGSLGKFEESTPLLNAAFFSPRYVVSRFNLLNPLKYAKMTPKARMEALKTVGAYMGVGLMTMAIAKAGSADVEDDPRSADFGKIKVGNTRFDIWAGMSQLAVLLSRLATNKTKSTSGDVKVLGEGYKPTTRMDVLGRFGRSKLSPSVGIATDFLIGKDFNGNDVTVSGEVMKSILPLWSSDIYNISQDENSGPGVAAAAGVASFFGVGVQNYKNKTSKQGQNKPKPIPSPIK